MAIEKDKLIWMYRTMVRHREFEDRVLKEFGAGNIPGFVHLSQGQEAIPAGVMAVLKPDDYILTHHRGHGHLVAKGGDTARMMAELYGKKTGIMKGKGGSMHLTDPDVGDLGADGNVTAIDATDCLVLPGVIDAHTHIALDTGALRSKFVEIKQAEATDVDLSKADVIVSGGRIMVVASPFNWSAFSLDFIVLVASLDQSYRTRGSK